MRFLLDTSVLVPLFTADAWSVPAEEWLSDHRTDLIVSDFAAAEFASAVARKHREGRLSRTDAESALSSFDRWALCSSGRLPLVNADVLFAEAVIRRLEHTLRTPDALHLAAAHRLDATLVSFDRQLAATAVALGLRTAPA